MAYLITSSLLDSIEWCKSAPTSIDAYSGKTWRQKALDDCRNQLARIWTDSGPALKRGKAFEETLYKEALKNNSEGASSEFQWFIDRIKGGTFQKKTRRIINVDDIEYALYGRIDVYFKDCIKDIKTTKEYRGKDKYLSSSQHLIYCYNENITNFDYLIAEFNGEDDLKIVNTHEVHYEMTDRKAVEDILAMRIRAALQFFKTMDDFLDLYKTKFCQWA